VDRRSGGNDKIASNVRCEATQSKKADEVNHSSDDAQERR
jgi:hypothetical protein